MEQRALSCDWWLYSEDVSCQCVRSVKVSV